jgi:hypothetical protein
MIKKIIAIFLIGLCISTMSACKKDKDKDTEVVDTTNPTVSASETVTDNVSTPSEKVTENVTSSVNEPSKEVKPTEVKTNPTVAATTTATTPSSLIVSSPSPSPSPSQEEQKPIATIPIEELPKVEEIVNFEIPEIEKNKNDYIIKNETSNISDTEGLSKFQYNNGTHDLSNVTVDSLKQSGIDLCVEDSFNYVGEKWIFKGSTFGIINGNNVSNEFYIDLTEDKKGIESIATSGENTNVTFFRGIKCGMTIEEIAPLLEGSMKQVYRQNTVYIFKDSQSTLMLETFQGKVDFIILTKNSTIKNWQFLPY